MRDGGVGGVAFGELRAGLRVSAGSIGWTTMTSAVAIALGANASSLVLLAFGGTGLLDAAGSVTLVAHFRHALRHDSFSERHERRALRLIVFGLLAVGSVTAVESGRRLLDRAPARAVPAGLAVAAASIVVLAVLSWLKLRIGRRLPSRALRADGWLSATGCLLAVVTVAGTGLTSAFGWWWADPLAAATVAAGAVGIAVVMARSASSSVKRVR